jgi:putative zinc finger/helix-turn-helix YgiT family protein
MLKHDCRNHIVRKVATVDHPFLMTWSGLPNVYISGIRYEACQECGKVAGMFPAVAKLYEALVKVVAIKPSALSGEEIRFLRISVRKKAMDFAKVMGVSPEQVSRWEHGHNQPEKAADKLIRVLACKDAVDSVMNLDSQCSKSGSYLMRFSKAKEWLGEFVA